MNIDELRMLGRDCYAVFNQNAPEHGARAWVLWAEICADIPVAATPFVRAKITDLDFMPRNLGKTVRQYGLEWKFTRGIGKSEQQACPDCDPETIGFFSAWEKIGNGRLDG